jgi:hypothetical protein
MHVHPPPLLLQGAQGGRKRPPPESDSFFEDGHHPGTSRLRTGRSPRGRRDLRPRACRQGANEVGLLLRTVDPSLLDDTALSGNTLLSLAQVAQCLRRMLMMASSRHAHGAEHLLPRHTDWLSSTELGFPLVVDQFHRDVHPLIRQYVCAQIRAGDQTLGPLLRFRGGSGNGHCEISDQGTGRGLLLICDQCECTYHEDCLGDLIPNAGSVFICPKCWDVLDEVINRRLREQRPPPLPWERCSIPLRMLDPPVLPECPDAGLPLTTLLASPPTGGYVTILKDPIEFAERWHDSQISTSEGTSSELSRALAPRLGAELVPFIHCEAQLQRSIDATGKVHCIAWVVLRAARDLYGATHYLGGTAVTTPPFFATAARSVALFWHPVPHIRCSGGQPPGDGSRPLHGQRL